LAEPPNVLLSFDGIHWLFLATQCTEMGHDHFIPTSIQITDNHNTILTPVSRWPVFTPGNVFETFKIEARHLQ
jgi:hypothetical protein